MHDDLHEPWLHQPTSMAHLFQRLLALTSVAYRAGTGTQPTHENFNKDVSFDHPPGMKV